MTMADVKDEDEVDDDEVVVEVDVVWGVVGTGPGASFLRKL
jgi:hypothetical protein